MINWPNNAGIPSSFQDHFAEIADSIYDGDGSHPKEIGLQPIHSGQGRVVYDISHKTGIDAVLKVSYCDAGLRENRHEIYDRNMWDSDLQERLVPVLHHGHSDMWVVQPKVDTRLTNEQLVNAKDELSYLVSEAGGDTREVYADNIGLYGGQFVIFDHGGL